MFRNNPTAETQSENSSGGWLRVALWNLVFFLVGAEMLAVGLYFIRTGSLYYLDPPAGRSVPLSVASVEGYRIHPYFGFQLQAYSGHTGGSFANNNHGFTSPWDYPRQRREGEVLVGIFGGSVASYLAQYEAEHGVIARLVASTLEKRPEEIVVLNFGQGGFKQPQQVQVLSYFLATGQELDAVVNIDGFNEVTLGALNQLAGVGATQPSVEHVLGLQAVTPIVTSTRRATMVQARHTYARFAQIYNRAWSGEAPETRVAVGFLWHFVRYKFYNRKFLQMRLAVLDTRGDGEDQSSWFYLQPADREDADNAGEGGLKPDEVYWPPVLDVWQHGAVTLARIAHSAGSESVHVLQPNQYFATDRQFSEAERDVAFSDASPFRRLVPAGYERLATRAKQVTAAGVPVHDLLRLFDDLEAQAYSDDCCHYSPAGNERLARALGKLLQQEFERASGP